MEPTAADAEGLLTKLRAFAAGLDREERALLGALVAPGVARAIGEEPPLREVGRASDGTGPLPEVLRSAIRNHPEVLPALAPDPPA